MAIEVTPVHRNLHQRVTFSYLEFEDLFDLLQKFFVVDSRQVQALGILAE